MGRFHFGSGGRSQQQQKSDFEVLQHHLVFLQEQNKVLDAKIDYLQEQILAAIYTYDANLRLCLFPELKKIKDSADLENTLLIERLDKIEAHMALVAIKVPDMSEEEYVERKHVNGTSEHPAITTGVGSSEAGGTPTQDSIGSPAPAKARNTRSRATTAAARSAGH